MKTKKSLFGIMILFSLILISLTSAITIKSVSSFPNDISQGEIVTVSIEIKNILEEDTKNINAILDLNQIPFAPYQSSSNKYLEQIDEGETESIKFKLIALPETKAGIYKIPITINYENSESIPGSKSGLISLSVNPSSELKASLDDSVILLKGRKNEVPIIIINSGLGDAKFVFLSLADVSGLSFLSNQEQYYGDIDSDDFNTMEYKVHAYADAPDNLEVPIVIKYKDLTNQEHIERSTVSLRIYSLEEAQNLGLVPKQNYIIYILIGCTIMGFVVYKIINKKIKKKKRKK